MRCKNEQCGTEINNSFKFAISKNICPACGEMLMEEHLKNLFVTLTETMNSLSEYKDQLNDWMLSNYNFIKTDSENIISYVPKDLLKKSRKEETDEEFQERKNKKFKVKVKNDAGNEEEIDAEQIQSDEKTASFFKRAEAVKPNIDGFSSAAEKTQHLKAIAQQIRKEGNTALGNSGSKRMKRVQTAEDIEEMDSEMSEEEDIEIPATPELYSGEDEIPAVVLNMGNRNNGRNMSQSEQSDLFKLRQMEERRNNSKNAFENGENRGKGGFSRS